MVNGFEGGWYLTFGMDSSAVQSKKCYARPDREEQW